MKSPVYFDWGVSTLFGWGVYGLALLRHWQGVSGSPAFAVGQIQLSSLAGMDPLSLRALADPLIQSDHLRLALEAMPLPRPPLDGILINSLGNQMTGSPPPSAGGMSGSVATTAAIFFENTDLPHAAAISREYAVILAGSSWCEAVLRERGVENVATVIQGVDPSIFHPAPRSGSLADRFAVFSGGKIEYRKGQDLVVIAFRAFAKRHPEAILVTAWHSPWPITAVTINSNPALFPISLTEDGESDISGWIAGNGIGADQFIDLGTIPNHQMARVLREMDVAVFPNRCEGGTNLVAMECMACGIPTILSDNTGHKDLIAADNCYVLSRQSAIILDDRGTQGWGESDVDEIVESLEAVWQQRDESRRRGAMGAEAMAQLSWRRQIGRLHDVLQLYGP
jgi:glycosyltransferase involved in cell wall biosynthesis